MLDEQIAFGTHAELWRTGNGLISKKYKSLYRPAIEIKTNIIRDIRSRLVEGDIPTYETFQQIGNGAEHRMSDLSDNKRNLVLSLPDLQWLSEDEIEFWQRIIAHRKQPVNTGDFLQQNRSTIDKLIRQRLMVNKPGFILTCKPEGELNMWIGDYDDGISPLNRNEPFPNFEKSQLIHNYQIFLTRIVRDFFPSTERLVDLEINDLNSLYNLRRPLLGLGK